MPFIDTYEYCQFLLLIILLVHFASSTPCKGAHSAAHSEHFLHTVERSSTPSIWGWEVAFHLSWSSHYLNFFLLTLFPLAFLILSPFFFFLKLSQLIEPLLDMVHVQKIYFDLHHMSQQLKLCTCCIHSPWIQYCTPFHLHPSNITLLFATFTFDFLSLIIHSLQKHSTNIFKSSSPSAMSTKSSPKLKIVNNQKHHS